MHLAQEDPDALDHTASECRVHGAAVVVHAGDVADPQVADALRSRAASEFCSVA